MRGYLIEVACPLDGAELDHVNAVTRHGSEAVGVAKCSRCSREYAVNVQLRVLALPSGMLEADRRKARS